MTKNFKTAIVAECIASITGYDYSGFSPACIEYAFDSQGSYCMQDFLVDAWLAGRDLDYAESKLEGLPTPFVYKLCLSDSTPGMGFPQGVVGEIY